MNLKRKPKTYVMETKTDIFNGKPRRTYELVEFTAKQIQKSYPKFDNGVTKISHISQGVKILERGMYLKTIRILTGTEASKHRKLIKNESKEGKATKV